MSHYTGPEQNKSTKFRLNQTDCTERQVLRQLFQQNDSRMAI